MTCSKYNYSHPPDDFVPISFGQKINFHPHLHCLVTEGGEDGEGKCHHLAFQELLMAAETSA